MRSIASLWSDIITCSSPGRPPRLACVWEMASHINITRYRTWLWGESWKKKRWIRSRCTAPLGLGRFNFKAQYFSRKSIGVQAVSSMRKTSGSRRRWCPGFSYHPGYEKGISWKRYKAKLNLARGCTNVIITHTLPRTLSCTGITLVPLNRISGQAYDYTQLSEVRLPSWQSYSRA